jgi:uncharacterized protein affecting Mg2+/Co2+ transport
MMTNPNILEHPASSAIELSPNFFYLENAFKVQRSQETIEREYQVLYRKQKKAISELVAKQWKILQQKGKV